MGDTRKDRRRSLGDDDQKYRKRPKHSKNPKGMGMKVLNKNVDDYDDELHIMDKVNIKKHR